MRTFLLSVVAYLLVGVWVWCVAVRQGEFDGWEKEPAKKFSPAGALPMALVFWPLIIGFDVGKWITDAINRTAEWMYAPLKAQREVDETE